jgi:hypothetical protein
MLTKPSRGSTTYKSQNVMSRKKNSETKATDERRHERRKMKVTILMMVSVAYGCDWR